MLDIKSAILFKPDFFEGTQELYNTLSSTIQWDDSMRARKTASFGQPYAQSEKNKSLDPFLPFMHEMSERLEPVIGYKANNCFLNYYENGKSKMGWHADTTHFLEDETGVAIVSLGDTRIFQIRRKAVPTELLNYVLTPGSLIYMPIAVQEEWQHAIPKVVSERGRISLTFRKMKME